MIKYIYLHIPFCLKKCKYCSFCSFPMLRKKEEYIDALIKEISYSKFLSQSNNVYFPFSTFNFPLTSIYFGGGTPSLLEISDFERILSQFNYDNKTQITLEMNPNDVNQKKLKDLKSLGINRISLGVQSFDNDILSEIGRKHNKDKILNSINLIKDNFNNFSIDLMYGLPNQSLSNWQKTLESALNLNIPHISLYGLKIEEGSYYFKFPPKNLPSSDLQAEMYEKAIDILKEKYCHYEFSNFAINEDFYSIHNLAYWKRENYWGFGLSASGFVDNKRYTNTFNFKDYINNPTKKQYETLTKKQEIEEEIFLGLRINEGINFNYINKKYDIDIEKIYFREFQKFLNDGFMEKTEKGIKLTKKGILVSNEILCEFIEI